MKSGNVTETLSMVLEASGCGSAKVIHTPRLLNDNDFSFISRELAEWLSGKGMDHTREAPMHPQIQGKIERWHQTLKKTASCSKTFICRVNLSKK